MADQFLVPLIPSTPDLGTSIDQSRRGELEFLRFPLAAKTQAILPVDQLTEVLMLAANQVIPIPDMPVWVLGVHNWRGEILWIVDLGHLLGLPSLHQQSAGLSSLIILVTQESGGHPTTAAHLGLAVQGVDDLHWCNPADIASPPPGVVTPSLAPFLRGYTLGQDGEMLLALDTTALFENLSLPSPYPSHS